MTHFAKIENGIVTQISVVDEEYFNSNPERYTGQWIKTSYNTKGGIHLLGGTPLRKNYAGIGYIYDEQRDAFYAPQPYPSWTLNEETCIWEAPIPYPQDSKPYVWNDNQGVWEELVIE